MQKQHKAKKITMKDMKNLENEIKKEFPSKGTLLEQSVENLSTPKEEDELILPEPETQKPSVIPAPNSMAVFTYSYPSEISSVSDAQKAVLATLEISGQSPLSRSRITEIIGATVAKKATTPKNSSGKDKWIYSVDAAISHLKARGEIDKVGSNAYVIGKGKASPAPKAKAIAKASPAPQTATKPTVINPVLPTPQSAPQPAQATPPPVAKATPKVAQATSSQITQQQIAQMKKQIKDEIKVQSKGMKPASPTKAAKVEKIEESFKEVEERKKPLVEEKAAAPSPLAKAVEGEQKKQVASEEGIDEGDLFVTRKPAPYYGEKDLDLVMEAQSKGNFKRGLLLEGPKGTGKTQAVINFAYKKKLPLITIQCNGDTTDADLLGHDELRADGSSGFKIGVLPRAVNIANKYGTAILLVDEANALKEKYQVAFNSLLDGRFEVTADGKAWKLNPNANLIIIGTMNPQTYGGMNPVNEAFASRWAREFIDYPTHAKEATILTDFTKDKDVVDKLIQLADFTRDKVKAEPDFYALSTRELKAVAEEFEGFKASGQSKEEALRLALKFFVKDQYRDYPSNLEAMVLKIGDLFKVKV